MSGPTARQQLSEAYEGLEAEFSDRAAEESYRASMLERTREQADLVEPMLQVASVLEIGCGNGRLLVELARRGAVREGTGIDPARSRIQFAQRWAEEERLACLRFEAADALAYESRPRSLDAVFCITGTFAYFEPLEPGASAALLKRWREALTPGGLLVLELYPHPEIIHLLQAARGPLRLWRELAPEDPWRFYLSEFSVDSHVLLHTKTFIHRTSGEVDSGRRERLALYTESGLRQLLSRAGFVQISCRDGWSDRPYLGSETMVVTARAPKPP